MITRIKLQRFKKFRDNEIQLAPFTVLMGENSCGKTTVIQAINLSLNTFAKSDLIQEKNGKYVAKSKGIGATTLPGIGIADFRELYYGKISRQSSQMKKNFGAVIELEDEVKNIYRLQVSSLFGGFNLKCLSTEEELKNNPEIYQYTPLLISGFVGLEESEQRSFPVNIRQHLSSGNVSSIIRNLVLDLKKNNPDNYHKLEERLMKDFGFHLDNVEFNEQKDMYVKAAYSEKLEDKKISFDFNSSGSGYMQILQILAPIYTVCPHDCKVVLLDEPDAHLHPNMQISLAKSLQKIQKELDIQIIVSTHSSAIIKSVKPGNVVPVSAENYRSVPLSLEEEVEDCIAQLDNYALAKSVISGKMVFIEDANLDIWEAFDRVLGTRVFYGANTASIYSGRSKDDKIPFQIKPVLEKFLSKEIEIVFVRDSDGLNDEWRSLLNEYSNAKNVKLCVLNRYEIENYILIPKWIYNAILKKYPDKDIPSIEEIETKIIEFLKNTITFAKYKYDDVLEDSIFKTGLLLNRQEYRNTVVVKSEAEKIRSTYESSTQKEDFFKCGMGKEALKQLFKWLNDEKHLNLNKEDVLEEITSEDINDEIVSILQLLKSNLSSVDITAELETYDEETIVLEEHLDDSDSVQGFVQLELVLPNLS